LRYACHFLCYYFNQKSSLITQKLIMKNFKIVSILCAITLVAYCGLNFFFPDFVLSFSLQPEGVQTAGIASPFALILMACTLVAYSEDCDEEGNVAGIDTLWFAGKDDIDAMTFSTNGELTALTMVTGKTFKKWKFQEDTAFFNQPKTVVNKRAFYKPTISFVNSKISTALINAIEALDNCSACGVVAIVKDNNGKKWLAGVRYITQTDQLIKPLFPAASDGAVSGANSESDANQVTTVLESKQGKLCREATLTDASIPV